MKQRVRCGVCNNVIAGAGVKGMQAHERRDAAREQLAIDAARNAGQSPNEAVRAAGYDNVAAWAAKVMRGVAARGGPLNGAYILDGDMLGFYCKRCHIAYATTAERLSPEGDTYLRHADRLRPQAGKNG